jgi:hypothetical protein
VALFLWHCPLSTEPEEETSVTLLVRAMGDLNQLEETTVISLIRVLRDLGRRAEASRTIRVVGPPIRR